MPTFEVLRVLNASYNQIAGLINRGKITRPAKNERGDFVWAPADIERARKALAVDLRYKAARPAKTA
jgi:hypothetical protein